PPSGGGLTSRITFFPAPMVTLSPSRGTFFSGQLARSDQRVGLIACDPFFLAASTTASALARQEAGTSKARRNGRSCFLMASIPCDSPQKRPENSANLRRQIAPGGRQAASRTHAGRNGLAADESAGRAAPTRPSLCERALISRARSDGRERRLW